MLRLLTGENNSGANSLRTASFEIKRSLEQFLAERIVFKKKKKKTQSIFVMNGTKCSSKIFNLETKAQGEDTKSNFLLSHQKLNIGSLLFVFLWSS